MDLGETFHIWRKRWVLTFSLLILVLAGAAAAQPKLPRTYQSDSSMVLLASRKAARLNGGNPWLSFSPSLTLTADVLSRELTAPATVKDLAASGFTESYSVALAPFTTATTGSVVIVTVTGHDQAAVESTLGAVTREVGVKLARLQHSLSPGNRIRIETLSYAPEATLSVGKTARAGVIVTGLGLLIALGIPVIADGLIRRRQIRTGRQLADPVPAPVDLRPSDRPNVAEQDRAAAYWPSSGDRRTPTARR